MKFRNMFILFSALALVVALAACGGKQEEPTVAPAASSQKEDASQAQPGATNTPIAPQPTNTPLPQPTNTPAPTPTKASVASETAEASDEAGFVSMSKLEDILDSYRSRGMMRLTITFPDDRTEEQEVLIESAWTKADHEYGFDMSMTMSSSGMDEEGPQEISIYMVGDTTSINFGGEWLTQSRQGEGLFDMPTFLLDPDAFFADIENMKEVGQETVNGVKTIHYAFDDIGDLTDIFGAAAAEQSQLKSLQGDVWVAKDGSYVVKSNFEATVENAAMPGETGEVLTEQTMLWQLEVYEVNGDITIEAPEGAAKAGEISAPGFDAGEFPLPPETTVLVSMGDITMLESTLGEAELTAFFEEALTNLGWSKQGDGPFASWSKDGYTLSVIITPGDKEGVTNIMIQGAADGS
ncbi:MAG: hypothetical protein GXP42_16825 [Chloroflexi bacterium]|nr:hypothetical protein [Chloroflexota bacterium]